MSRLEPAPDWAAARIAELERRIRDALLHYQIGEDASGLFAIEAARALPVGDRRRGLGLPLAINANADLVVSWRYVAERMAAALRGEEEDQR
jgi:hypothetical protein